MKKIITLISILIFIISYNYSQWHVITENNGNIEYLDLFVQTDERVYCAGYSINHNNPMNDGIIVRTTNGGISWDTTMFVGTPVWSILFTSDSIGYAGAVGTNIYKTTDGGESWINLNSNLPNFSLGFAWRSIAFLNDDFGFFSNKLYPHRLIKTIDGGLTWNIISIDGSEAAGGALCFASQDIGYSGQLFKTTDGGNTWFYNIDTTLSVPDMTNHDMEFINDSVGFYCGVTFKYNHGTGVSGYGSIAKTNNGGVSYSTMDLPFMGHLSDLEIVDNKVIYLVGISQSEYPDDYDISILISDSLGENWYYQKHNPETVNLVLTSVDFWDSKIGYAAGAYGIILKTTDSGGQLYPVPNISIEEYTFQPKNILHLYPNPANESMVVSGSGNELRSIEIYNLNGQRLLKQQSSKSEETIVISYLPPGNYFLRAISNNEVFVRKFVVLR